MTASSFGWWHIVWIKDQVAHCAPNEGSEHSDSISLSWLICSMVHTLVHMMRENNLAMYPTPDFAYSLDRD